MDENVAKAVDLMDHGFTLNGIGLVHCAHWQTIRARLVELEAENERLRDMLRQVHKDYGCEIRDPCGTIWEHAASVQNRADKADALLRDIKSWDVGGSLGPKRAALLALPIDLRARITAHLSENGHDHS